MNDEIEQRKSGLGPEKLATIILSGAALAFTVYQSWMGFVGVVQRDIDAIATQQSVLEARVQSHYDQRGPWLERIVELERKHAAVYDRISVVTERLVRCEQAENIK